MKNLATCALVLLLTTGSALAGSEISLSLSSKEPDATVADRHDVDDARLAITTRDGSTSLLLFQNKIAVQLTDDTLAKVESEKKNPGFFEELVIAGVRLALGKAIDYPIANIRSAAIENGALRLINNQNKPVFTELKVNGKDVLENFSTADAAKFVKAFRAAKSER